MGSAQAPKAVKIPKHLEIHGDLRLDNYYWMNDRNNRQVIEYLEQENEYYFNQMKHTHEFQTSLFPGNEGPDQRR